jgi:hypothetical protein
VIVGNGDLASVIPDRTDRIYFASGVSNSVSAKEWEYQAEKNLLLAQDKTQHLVYFGSLCIYYNHTRYQEHKKYMEELVKSNFPHYTIVRLGLITWGTNPNTLINFLKGKVERKEPYEIRDTVRYVVEKDEFLHWLNLIPEWNSDMNITGRMMTIQQIFDTYVQPK